MKASEAASLTPTKWPPARQPDHKVIKIAYYEAMNAA
jgi:hypothetical protein